MDSMERAVLSSTARLFALFLPGRVGDLCPRVTMDRSGVVYGISIAAPPRIRAGARLGPANKRGHLDDRDVAFSDRGFHLFFPVATI